MRSRVEAGSVLAGQPWRLTGDAGEFRTQSALDLFGMPLAPGYSTDIGAVYLEAARDPAVQAAERLHVTVDPRNLFLSIF